MPLEHIEIMVLIGGTTTAKTFGPEKFEEWHKRLETIRADITEMGPESENELAFVEALLAVMDDQPATLPADNPYRPHFEQLSQMLEDEKLHRAETEF
jgi:hypothetical protein